MKKIILKFSILLMMMILTFLFIGSGRVVYAFNYNQFDTKLSDIYVNDFSYSNNYSGNSTYYYYYDWDVDYSFDMHNLIQDVSVVSLFFENALSDYDLGAYTLYLDSTYTTNSNILGLSTSSVSLLTDNDSSFYYRWDTNYFATTEINQHSLLLEGYNNTNIGTLVTEGFNYIQIYLDNTLSASSKDIAVTHLINHLMIFWGSKTDFLNRYQDNYVDGYGYGYDEGFDIGFSDGESYGYTQGYSDGQASGFGFNVLGAITNAAQFTEHIFTMNIGVGFTLASLFLIPLVWGFVTMVIRLTKGGK